MLELSSVLASQVASDLGIPSSEAAGSIGQQLGIAEWLGPLAPVALSPFFGLAALSGIATYGPDWLQQHSALLQSGGSMDNPALFWTMASLAVLTSLPRLTKVSKPIALAAEKLEAYSAIIILIVVRLFAAQFQTGTVLDQTQADGAIVAAGLGTFSLNLILSLFAAMNVFVINVVKLFGEFLVWLIPIPTIDAVAEVANKSACAGLMALYCYSPWIASVINLTILLLCAMVFSWVYRRLNLYRELITGPILAWLAPSWFAQKGRAFNAFVENSPTLPRFSRVCVTVNSDGEYLVRGIRWCVPFEWRLRPSSSVTIRTNRILSQSLALEGEAGRCCVIVFRKWVPMDAFYQNRSRAPATLA